MGLVISIDIREGSTLKAIWQAIAMAEKGNAIVTHIKLCDKSMDALLEEVGMGEEGLRINGLPAERYAEDVLYVEVPNGQFFDASAWAGAIPKMEKSGKEAAIAGRILRQLIQRRN